MKRSPRRSIEYRSVIRRRVSTATFAIAVLLVAAGHAVGAQVSRIALVDVPIPRYPHLAVAAGVSGDVRVTVEVRSDGTVAFGAVYALEALEI